jgi:hypothetical protein
MNRGFQMHLSTNLPSGPSAVERINQNPEPLPANVSEEADAAFIAELARTDEPRYNRLVTNIQKAAFALDRRTEPADQRCPCGASLDGKRHGSKWCSDTCRKRLGRQNNPETHIQNKEVADAKSDGWWGGSLELTNAATNGVAAL